MGGGTAPHAGGLRGQAHGSRETGDDRDHQGAEEDDEADRRRHILLLRLQSRLDAGDGGSTADAESAADEHGQGAVDLERFGQGDGREDAGGDDDGGEDEDEPAEVEDVTEHDLRAEGDDAQAQQRLRREVESGHERLGEGGHEIAQEDAEHDRHEQRREHGQEHGDRPRDGRGRSGDGESGQKGREAVHGFSLSTPGQSQ